MDVTKSQIVYPRLPYWTLGIIALSVSAYASTKFGSVLIYDRAAILNGQVWRLLSGHFVHFSLSHLIYDLTVLALAGWIIETRGYPLFGVLCVVMTLAIGLVLLVTTPDMIRFGGLSGLACGAVAYLALWGLLETGPWRKVCVGVLLFMLTKVGFEIATRRPVFVSPGETEFTVMPIAHITGGLVAALFFSGTGLFRNGSRLGPRHD